MHFQKYNKNLTAETREWLEKWLEFCVYLKPRDWKIPKII